MKPESESKEHEVDRIEYLLERKRMGKFIYSNFQAVRNSGVSPYTKIKPIRPELGDYEHVASFALRYYSSLYLSPVFAYEFYRLGKIIGYCTIDGLLKTLKIKPLIRTLAKTGLLSKVFQNKQMQEALRRGWQSDGGALIDLVEIDKERKRLKYVVKEDGCAIIKTLSERYQFKPLSKPCNYIELGILCGQTEALFEGLWDGIETKCMAKGDPHCEMIVYHHEEEINPEISVLTREEYEEIRDMTIEVVVRRDDTGRKKLGDPLMISVDQSLNYLLLSTSKGHIILSKWAGKKVGERVIRKAEVNSLLHTLKYLEDMFRYLKMGLIEYELTPEVIMVTVKESVYSSGVKNINMKLCIFMAGIMEGAFIEATKVGWLVTETKCTANGDSSCVFECVTRDPEALGKLLLGE